MPYTFEKLFVTQTEVGTFHVEDHGATPAVGAFALMLTGKRCRKAKQIGWVAALDRDVVAAKIAEEVRERTAPADAPRYGMAGDGPVRIELVGKLKP